MQQQAIQQQADDYEDARRDEIQALQDSLNDEEAVISASFQHVQNNADVVLQNIQAIASQYGIQISQEIVRPWQDGEVAISGYQTTVDGMSSSFIDQLLNVENYERSLQEQANVTAEAVANVFGANANNLINEINAAQTAAANLQATMAAISQASVTALDAGYNINTGGVTGGGTITPSDDERRRTISVPDYSDPNSIDNNKWYGWNESTGEILFSKNSGSEASAEAKKLGCKYGKGSAYKQWAHNMKIPGFARGSKNISSDMLALTQENGAEIIRLPDGSWLTPLQSGAQVIPNDLTNKVWEFMAAPAQTLMDELRKNATPAPARNAEEAGFTVNYDSLVTVNGNVNDSQEMLAIATQTAEQKITKTFKDMSAHIYK